MAIAGHPPPLLIEDGRAEPVRVTSGPALGISDLGHTWPSERIEVGSAWMLLCYTDGLIEGLVAPDSAERFGTKRLVEEVGDLLVAAPDVDAMLDGLLDTVRTANGGDLSDDVAILCLSSAGLAIQRPGPEPSA